MPLNTGGGILLSLSPVGCTSPMQFYLAQETTDSTQFVFVWDSRDDAEAADSLWAIVYSVIVDAGGASFSLWNIFIHPD